MTTANIAVLDRQEAWNLVCQWTASASLRRHMLTVEAAMRACARAAGEDEELWGLTELVMISTTSATSARPAGIRNRRFNRSLRMDIPPPSYAQLRLTWTISTWRWRRLCKRTLYAVDELSGFITRATYTRGSMTPTMDAGIAGIRAAGRDQRMGERRFRCCSRARATLVTDPRGTAEPCLGGWGCPRLMYAVCCADPRASQRAS